MTNWDDRTASQQSPVREHVKARVADAHWRCELELGDRELVARAVVAHAAATVATVVLAHRHAERRVARGTFTGLVVNCCPLRWAGEIPEHRHEHRALVRRLSERHNAPPSRVLEVHLGTSDHECDCHALARAADRQVQRRAAVQALDVNVDAVLNLRQSASQSVSRYGTRQYKRS